MNPSNDKVIEVKEVYKSFKTVHAVKGVTLSIPQGQFVALLGPNGAGKTTLVEMIEGIQKPDKGEILIRQKKWKGNENELRKLIGLSLQETYFIDKLTVFETLKLFASFYNLNKIRANEIIQIVGLEEKRKSYVVNLSGGQRQKLALGIALINQPEILILDEPTTGLDPNARREVWSILNQLKKETKTSLLLTTHYMEEAEKLCDYVIIMYDGNILKEGKLGNLLTEGDGEKLIEFTLDGIYESIESSDFPSSFCWDSPNQKGFIGFKDIENELPVFFTLLKNKGYKLKNIECRRKTLDDLFISLTGRHLHE